MDRQKGVGQASRLPYNRMAARRHPDGGDVGVLPALCDANTQWEAGVRSLLHGGPASGGAEVRMLRSLAGWAASARGIALITFVSMIGFVILGGMNRGHLTRALPRTEPSDSARPLNPKERVRVALYGARIVPCEALDAKKGAPPPSLCLLAEGGTYAEITQK